MFDCTCAVTASWTSKCRFKSVMNPYAAAQKRQFLSPATSAAVKFRRSKSAGKVVVCQTCCKCSRYFFTPSRWRSRAKIDVFAAARLWGTRKGCDRCCSLLLNSAWKSYHRNVTTVCMTVLTGWLLLILQCALKIRFHPKVIIWWL